METTIIKSCLSEIRIEKKKNETNSAVSEHVFTLKIESIFFHFFSYDIKTIYLRATISNRYKITAVFAPLAFLTDP